VDRVSRYLRDKDLPALVRDTEGFARRHPDLFLGGSLVAGVLLARFLKSSADRQEAWAGERQTTGKAQSSVQGMGSPRPRSGAYPATAGGL